ncbi:MAG: hypothetical protein IJN94_04600 [Clostridia bacterium]|nr:hypothetical protein [Clostridia bacterium]
MALKIFNKSIEPQCAFCEYGSCVGDGETVLCRKIGGIMQAFSKCKKFRYDPLKREPKVISFSGDFSKEDFSL